MYKHHADSLPDMAMIFASHGTTVSFGHDLTHAGRAAGNGTTARQTTRNLWGSGPATPQV